MGERKVQCKYYPPDFDPTKLPKGVKKRIHKVRMMMPMSVQCNACGEFIYNGKKFNALIEPTNEEYLGIRTWRLTVRCPRCCANITMKTDPANCDYICESGATRNFEPWRKHNLEEAEKEEARSRAREDAMLELESKTYDAQREMDTLDRLDELRALRARQSATGAEKALTRVQLKGEGLTEDEEAELKAAFGTKKAPPSEPAAARPNTSIGGQLLMAGPAKREREGVLGPAPIVIKKRRVEPKPKPEAQPAAAADAPKADAFKRPAPVAVAAAPAAEAHATAPP